MAVRLSKSWGSGDYFYLNIFFFFFFFVFFFFFPLPLLEVMFVRQANLPRLRHSEPTNQNGHPDVTFLASQYHGFLYRHSCRGPIAWQAVASRMR